MLKIPYIEAKSIYGINIFVFIFKTHGNPNFRFSWFFCGGEARPLKSTIVLNYSEICSFKLYSIFFLIHLLLLIVLSVTTLNQALPPYSRVYILDNKCIILNCFTIPSYVILNFLRIYLHGVQMSLIFPLQHLQQVLDMNWQKIRHCHFQLQKVLLLASFSYLIPAYRY